MWNLSPFREVNLFHRKMPTVPALEISWNFNIFSKFTKFHQTCRTYLNHHQKHACEIWAHSEKLTYFIKKCWQCRPLKYHKISTFFQSSPSFIKLAEFIGIIIRNMHVKFEPIQRSYIFSQKNADSAGPRNMKISTFIQCSQNFIKLAEFIGIIIRNMHVKFEPIQRSYIFSQKNADSAGPRNIMKISTFIKCSQNFIKLAEYIGIIIRNMHVKFEPIQRS